MQAQTVEGLVGKVLTSSTGKRPLTIISEADYKFRRSSEAKLASQDKPLMARDVHSEKNEV